MADVYNYIEPTGVITTDDAGLILQQVNTEYQNAFGTDLIVPDSLNLQGASTPQGLLIITEALARIALADNNAILANQINPNVAGGIFLDAILALTGLSRNPATQSFCTINLNGVVGTSIPAGSQLQETTYGNTFETVNTYVIPTGGTYYGASLFSVDYGPINADANSTWTIVSSVLGLETATNNTQAQLGTITQSDISAREYRLNAIGVQGSSIAAAIIAAVTIVINKDTAPSVGVPSVKYLENQTSSPATIEGVSMVANSIYLCVNGGDTLTSYSTVVVTCSGTPTTIIIAGSQVETSTGFIFQNALPGTISGGGTVDIIFTSVTSGAVPCPIGAITTIVTPISGWASVTNAAAQTLLGVQSDVAYAMMSKKSAGCSYNNGPGVNIMATVIEPNSGQYLTVLYDNPNQIPIYIIVNIVVNTPVTDPIDSVKNAILNYVAGGVNGINGWNVGQNVSAFEIAGAITTQLPGIYTKTLFTSKTSTPTTSTEIVIHDYEIAITSVGYIIVNVLS